MEGIWVSVYGDLRNNKVISDGFVSVQRRGLPVFTSQNILTTQIKKQVTLTKLCDFENGIVSHRQDTLFVIVYNKYFH